MYNVPIATYNKLDYK